jgi:hypothetical protein
MRRCALHVPLLVVALLAALVHPSVSAGATAVSDWTEIPHAHPSGQDSYLYDSWSDGTDVWAAGARLIFVGGTFEWRTWVQRCGGSAGTCALQNTRDVEAAPAYNILQGMTGTSANDVWVAGYARATQGSIGPLVEHFDGASWTITPTPVAKGGLWGISAVSPTDVWAVGADNRVAFTERPLALHWNGATWVEDQIRPRGCEGNSPLWDVDASGPRPLAVGSCINAAGDEQAMIISRRASGWRRETITGIDPTTFDLQSVDWTGQTAWAGGRSSSGAVILRLRQGVWSPVPTPPEAGGVYGVTGTSNDAWAVGLLGTYGWMTMHWNGRRWKLVDDPGPGWLEAVTETGDGTAWAVGQKAGTSLIQRYDGHIGTP